MGSLKLRPTYRKLINHGWATSSVISLPIVIHHPHLEKTLFFISYDKEGRPNMSSRVRKTHTRELSQDKTSLSRASSIYFVSGDCEVSGWSERTDGNRDVRRPVKNGRPRSPATKTNSFLVDAATATNNLPVVR